MSEHERDLGAMLLAGVIGALVGAVVFSVTASRWGEVSLWYPVSGAACGFVLGMGLAED